MPLPPSRKRIQSRQRIRILVQTHPAEPFVFLT